MSLNHINVERKSGNLEIGFDMAPLIASCTMTARSLVNGVSDAGLSADPFFQLKRLSETGGISDKILRGFFIGLAIGFPVALAFCCWYPCLLRYRRRQRRRARQNAAPEDSVTARA
ncbi:hypothetical protein V2A60_005918 [Cordyceps javanica]|uniref:Uncharacterized protein n=1 Tax=Cordyceps javanica TaxID=43265 RepID=A0A545VQC5_9HYPO|nr:hypothetical protein IF1G_09575 [Cordyceps javanica]TQW03938.1 hypothetical protein IF2G_08767 [Cordyceps javanica]